MFCILFVLLITFYIYSGTFITINDVILIHWGFPHWLRSKESACNSGQAGDLGLIPGLGRFPEEGTGTPLQYSCLGNPIDGEAWQLQSMGSQKSQT